MVRKSGISVLNTLIILSKGTQIFKKQSIWCCHGSKGKDDHQKHPEKDIDRYAGSVVPRRPYEFDIETCESSSVSTNIRRAQQKMFGSQRSSTIGCVNCIGKNLEVANGQSQIQHNGVRLLAYNRNIEDDFEYERDDVSPCNILDYPNYPSMRYSSNRKQYRNNTKKSSSNTKYRNKCSIRKPKTCGNFYDRGCKDRINNLHR